MADTEAVVVFWSRSIQLPCGNSEIAGETRRTGRRYQRLRVGLLDECQTVRARWSVSGFKLSSMLMMMMMAISWCLDHLF